MDNESLGLPEVTQMICDAIEARGRDGRNFGVVLIPDQLLSSVSEMRQLFEGLAQIRQACPEELEAPQSGGMARDWGPLLSLMPPLSRALFQSFPERTRAEVCSCVCSGQSRKADLRGIETEIIFQSLVETELTRRVALGTYKGPFKTLAYSLPLEGRDAMPTNFDCDLGYTAGYTAGVLIDGHHTGVFVDVSRLKEDVDDWEVGGTPLTSLLTILEPPDGAGSGTPSCEICPRQSLLYDLSSENEYSMPEPSERTLLSPGPAQFDGPCAGAKTQTLSIPQMQRVRQMARMQELIADLKAKASGACPPEVLQAVRMILQGGVNLLRQL